MLWEKTRFYSLLSDWSHLNITAISPSEREGHRRPQSRLPQRSHSWAPQADGFASHTASLPQWADWCIVSYLWPWVNLPSWLLTLYLFALTQVKVTEETLSCSAKGNRIIISDINIEQVKKVVKGNKWESDDRGWRRQWITAARTAVQHKQTVTVPLGVWVCVLVWVCAYILTWSHCWPIWYSSTMKRWMEAHYVHYIGLKYPARGKIKFQSFM